MFTTLVATWLTSSLWFSLRSPSRGLMFDVFVNGFQVLVAIATVVTVRLFLTVSPTVAEPAGTAVASGADLFVSNCAWCHGAGGEGGAGPALAGGLTRFSSIEEVVAFVSTSVPREHARIRDASQPG